MYHCCNRAHLHEISCNLARKYMIKVSNNKSDCCNLSFVNSLEFGLSKLYPNCNYPIFSHVFEASIVLTLKGHAGIYRTSYYVTLSVFLFSWLRMVRFYTRGVFVVDFSTC